MHKRTRENVWDPRCYEIQMSHQRQESSLLWEISNFGMLCVYICFFLSLLDQSLYSLETKSLIQSLFQNQWQSPVDWLAWILGLPDLHSYRSAIITWFVFSQGLHTFSSSFHSSANRCLIKTNNYDSYFLLFFPFPPFKVTSFDSLLLTFFTVSSSNYIYNKV